MRYIWNRWFKDSETILWARIQMLVAALITTVAVIDPMVFSNYIPTGYMPIYIFVSGVITEFARRLRDKDL